jgi:hypothetical protein
LNLPLLPVFPPPRVCQDRLLIPPLLSNLNCLHPLVSSSNLCSQLVPSLPS